MTKRNSAPLPRERFIGGHLVKCLLYGRGPTFLVRFADLVPEHPTQVRLRNMHLHGVEGAQRFEISSRTVKQFHGVGLLIECLLSEADRRDDIAAMTQ